jgi:oligosaccharide repeat unit polymerase
VLQNRARWRFLISLLISLAYASAYAGRTVFLSLFLMLSGILLATRRVSPIRVISVFGVAGLLVFVIVGIALDKGGTTFAALFDSDVWDGASALGDVVVFYMLAALPSFDMHMLSKEHYDLGVNTFRFLFAVLNRIGFEAEVVPTIKEFQGLPFTSNVYTVYRPYFDDFSIFGAIFIQLFLGLLHGSLYRNMGKGPVHIMLYSIFLYPLFMQFFHDQYFSVLSMWIQYGLLLALYSYTSQRIWREEAV